VLSDLLLSRLPLSVRLLALAGLLFALGVFGSVAVAAGKHFLTPSHPLAHDSIGRAEGLRGPGLDQRRRAAQRRPAAVQPRSLARGIHPPRRDEVPPAVAAAPSESVAVAPATVAPAPAEAAPTGKAGVEPPAEKPEAPIGEPPAGKDPAGAPPAGEEEPPAEEKEPPAKEEPPAEEKEPPAKEEPPANEPPKEEPEPAEEPPAGEPGAAPSFAGARLSDYWLKQAAPNAITEVPDPAGSGQTVFKFTVGDSDELQISSNPRGELLSDPEFEAGDEFWWSTKFFLPADFPAETPGFVNLVQGPFGSPASGSPPFHIEVNEGFVQWQRNATYGFDIPWKMAQVRNRWVTLLVHERFARDGFLELWVDGQQVTFFASGSGAYNPNGVAPTTRLAMATMDDSNDVGPNALYLQQYRKRGMFDTLTTYAGPLLVGPTQASVGR
jgi:hypothetical protein